MGATSLALALIAGIGWYVFDSAEVLDDVRTRTLVVVEDAGKIASLNDGLWLAARQYVFDRNPAALDRYRKLAAHRQQLVARLLQIPRGSQEAAVAQSLVDAVHWLERRELKAVDLARPRPPGDDEDRLLAPEYLAGKERAANTAAHLGSLVRQNTESLLETRRRTGKFMLSAVVLAVSLLLFTWVTSLRVSAALVARRRREEVDRAEQARGSAFVADVRGALTEGANLQRVVEAMVDHLGAAVARIWILDHEAGNLVLQASAGAHPALDGSGESIPAGGSSLGGVASRRKPILHNHDSGLSLAGLPLLVETRVIGVLAMYSSSPISEATMTALSGVADTIAQGVQREHAEALTRQYAIDLEQANRRLEVQAATLARSADELAMARDAALESARLKSQFVANMSHEIRTPMTGILGMTDLTLETHLSQEQREYVGLIKSSAHSLLGLLNDILDFSKIEAGKLDFERVEFSLRATLDAALKPLTQRAFEKGLRFSWEVAADVPDAMAGDPGRLRQVLVNLAGNAIKFTTSGQVAVRATLARPGQGNSQLQIAVHDSGIGIPPDKRGVIFQPFMQADGSTTRQYGGTGLGLAICQHLVRLMGGAIWVEGDEGVGSTFTFSVPFDIPQTRTGSPEAISLRAAHSLSGGRRLRVLMAEDNPVTQKLVARLLEKRGHRVETVSNGAEALKALDSTAFDLVLMDVQMPAMGGLEATEEIRRRELRRPYGADGYRIPIVAMTASAMKGDRERCLDAGMDGYVSKPLQKDELFLVIESTLSRRAPALA